MTIKMSDLLFIAADAVIQTANKAQVSNSISITDLYTDSKNSKGLALIGAMIKNLVSEATGIQIEVTPD